MFHQVCSQAFTEWEIQVSEFKPGVESTPRFHILLPARLQYFQIGCVSFIARPVIARSTGASQGCFVCIMWHVTWHCCFLILRFMMLSLEFDHSCRYDYVEVRDGDSINSRVIGRFCGNNRPAPIQSSGNSLHVLFVSDGYKNFDGFFATFQESSGTAGVLSAITLKQTAAFLLSLD